MRWVKPLLIAVIAIAALYLGLLSPWWSAAVPEVVYWIYLAAYATIFYGEFVIFSLFANFLERTRRALLQPV